MKYLLCLPILLSLFACSQTEQQEETTQTEAPVPEMGSRWSKEKAWEWYEGYDWLVGTNFNPSTAINQLEFWQAATFDSATIDRELGWSAELGMNIHRVYLHNLLWEQDSAGFLQRLETYLEIADKHKLYTMFVLLDDVWDPVPQLGKQPEPVPHVHNSGWVQAPGAAILGDSTRHGELEPYIKGVIGQFANDPRVICWDLYNEPFNVANKGDYPQYEVANKSVYSLSLLKKVFRWAREINPSQPLTVGIWQGTVEHWGTPDSLPALDRFMLENSDVISFHGYDNGERMEQKIKLLENYGRPLFCTEYMARSIGSTFQSALPVLKEYNVAAINWGLVAGKSNTIYPWKSWRETFTEEPEVWFHDVLRPDGTPYAEEEAVLLRELTGRGME